MKRSWIFDHSKLPFIIHVALKNGKLCLLQESLPWHPYTNILQKAAGNGRRFRTNNFFADDYGDIAVGGRGDD